MKKRIVGLLLICCILFAVAGCSNAKTSKTYTFTVETGDNVSLKLDTSNGYDISAEIPFEISQNGTVLSQGIFIEAEQYDEYFEAVQTDSAAKIIDNGEKDSNKYIFWSYNESEFNYAILINGSNTGVLLGNAVSEESAKECFNRLTISLEK